MLNLKSRMNHKSFTILELTIAIGILGIGLIMIAAIFPVALFQHSRNLDQLRSTQITGKAKAHISRLSSMDLWVDPIHEVGGQLVHLNSPWYLIPYTNLPIGSDKWDAMIISVPWAPNETYADVINGLVDNNANISGNAARGHILTSIDIFDDRVAGNPNDPIHHFTENQLMEQSNRFMWFGFYKHLAIGINTYGFVICKHIRGSYAEQNLTFGTFAYAQTTKLRHIPVPWRVTVAYDRKSKRIFNHSTDDEGLGELAPPGSRFIIHGSTNPPGVDVPTGCGLTVSNVFDTVTSNGNVLPDPRAIEFIEDYFLPDFVTTGVAFDIWVFPPPVIGLSPDVQFGRKSPVFRWQMGP